MTSPRGDLIRLTARATFSVADLGSLELRGGGPRNAQHIAETPTALREHGPVIALAADHAGFELKNGMKAVLDEHSFSLIDLGPETADPVDYPDMTGKLSAVLKDGRAQEGLLVCGTGIGIAIAANRFPAYGPPCVTTSPRRVWRARTMVLTSSRLARA